LYSDVDDGQHCEGVAEGLVNHVPQMKYLLRARKKEQSLGKSGFF